LEVGATALILAHNRSNGDATPPRADVRGTRSVVDAARTLDISVHDHLVIAGGGFSSMRALGLM
jgi:DNA repair protein RadC